MYWASILSRKLCGIRDTVLAGNGCAVSERYVWDEDHPLFRTEYITIISIMVCMTVWDFVIGVLFGIIVSCKSPDHLFFAVTLNREIGFFFVVQNSQRTSIRSLHTGETTMSTVRRPSFQRAHLREVSQHTTIIRLQGLSPRL